MQRRVGAFFLFAFVAAPFHLAAADGLPEIKLSAKNKTPACVTPGRMMAYLKSRNAELSPRFESIATEYMRYGEQLGVRWDYAFYQMIIETGSLSYRRGNRAGDVKPTQNNFAGLGAVGGGEHGESFKDIATGVRAHLEHLLLYAGERLDNPTAERTRKVQEWGVLTSWHAGFKRAITYSDLAAKWAPGTRDYSSMLKTIAERFDEFCQQPDPRPELVQEARGQKAKDAAETKLAEVKTERPTGADLARRAIEESKAQAEQQRSALGVQQPAAKPPVPFKVLNAPPAPEADEAPAAAAQPAAAPTQPPAQLAQAAAKPATDTPAAKAKEASAKTKAPFATASIGASPKATPAAEKAPVQVASAASAAKPLVAAPSAGGQKCRVWTASYGGQKAMIIKSVNDKVVNFTVLDVNEGAEAREAEAFIAAYAKGGMIAGEFTTQSQALDKAFELCPEG